MHAEFLSAGDFFFYAEHLRSYIQRMNETRMRNGEFCRLTENPNQRSSSGVNCARYRANGKEFWQCASLRSEKAMPRNFLKAVKFELLRRTMQFSKVGFFKAN
jgi:hypothetical protein